MISARRAAAPAIAALAMAAAGAARAEVKAAPDEPRRPRFSLPPGEIAVPIPRDAPQPIAAPLAPDAGGEEGDDYRHSEDGAGPRLTFGRALTRGIADGWYGRFETEFFIQNATSGRRREGPLGGMLVGLEGWGSSDGGGGGVPMTLYLGYRQPLFPLGKSPGVLGMFGLGWHWLVIDSVSSDGGFGIFAPLARASLGFDLGGLRLLADGAVDYRWQWGADDRLQIKLGATLGLHSELWDG